MNKIIKNFAIIGCALVFLTGCTLLGNTNEKDSEKQKTVIKTFENMKKIDKTINTTEVTTFEYEEFTINVLNAEMDKLNKEVLGDLIQYNVYATVKREKFDITLNYQGINMSDVAELLVPKEYKKVIFSGEGYSVTVPKEDLVDSFLVFQSDGKNLKEWGPAKIYLSTYEAESWIENISTIEFK